MRVAVMIIALILMVIIGLQSCAVGIGGAIAKDEKTEQGGSVGIFVALLFLIGGAFALKIPIASVIIFTIAAMFGFAVSNTTGYSDMSIWGSISLILAIMSYFGNRKLKAEKKEESAEA